MVQRVPVASVSNAASFGARSLRCIGLRPQFDDRRGEAHQVHRVQQMRVQHRVAVLGDQCGDVAEARQPRLRRCRRWRLGRRGQYRRNRRRPPRGRPRRRGGGAAGGGALAGVGIEPAHQVARAGGRSATWHRRISTISAAARRSGAASTSPMPFSSICQARARVGTDRRSASSAPRVRSASGRSWLLRRAGMVFSRVSVCSSSSRSASMVPRSAPRS